MNELKSEKKVSSLKTWLKLVPFFKPYKTNVIFIFVFMFTNALIDIVYPLLAEYAISNFIEPRQTAGIWVFSAVYFVIVLLQAASVVAFTRAALNAEVYLRRDLVKSMFTHLQNLSFSYYNVTPVGSIMSRVMSDTERIGGIFAWSLVDIFWSGTYIVGCIIVMLIKNWRLALLILTIVPVITLLTLFFQKKILAINRKVRSINSEITRQFNEGISGAKTSKTLVIEDKNTETFKSTADDMRKTTVHSVMLGAIYVPLIVFFTSLAVAFVLTSGGNMILGGSIDVAELTVFVTYALIIADPVQTIARTISGFIAAQANIERCTELLETEPEIKDTPQVIETYGTTLEPKKENWEPIEGNISFEDISFMYSDGTEYVLEHFNLDIPAGSTIAIVGETGAGKSTLVNLACRFFEPTKGRVLIDGRDYRDRSILWLHSSLGYVLQTPHLFSGSVRENIRYGKLDATDDDIIEAAKMVNAHEFIMAMENGYNSDVGEGGGNLSTGEKQLISFARAILAKPKIFVLDEATSSIDTKTESLIQDAISTMLENRTSFLIAHRLSTIRQADLILVVRKGKITERGTHEELMKKAGYYADLYNKQFENEISSAVMGN